MNTRTKNDGDRANLLPRQNKHVDCMEVLIEYPDDNTNLRANTEFSDNYIAASNGKTETLMILPCYTDTDIKIKDKYGMTSLLNIGQKMKLKSIGSLLESNNIVISVPDNDDMSPFSLTTKQAHRNSS